MHIILEKKITKFSPQEIFAAAQPRGLDREGDLLVEHHHPQPRQQHHQHHPLHKTVREFTKLLFLPTFPPPFELVHI